MKKFFLNLQFIFKPHFWSMLIPYNKKWDEDLNYLIDNCDAVLDEANSIDNKHYTIIFRSGEYFVSVWVQNYPYSYGRPYLSLKYEERYRPSRLTILKLRKLQLKLLKK